MLLARASAGHAVYVVLVVLHVIVAIVGFGAVAISGSYGATARHVGRSGSREELRRYFGSESRVEWLLLIVPVLGVAALIARPGPSELGRAWVDAALAVWLAAAYSFVRVVRPAERRIRALLAVGTDKPGTDKPGTDKPGTDKPGTDKPGTEALLIQSGARLAWAGAACDVAFGVALLLMIFQP